MKRLRKLWAAVGLGRRMVRALRPHLREQKAALIGTVLLSALVLVLRMAQPWSSSRTRKRSAANRAR